jgi:protein TonB
MGRTWFAYSTSGVFHALLLAWLGAVSDVTPPRLLPTAQGRASIALAASMAAPQPTLADLQLPTEHIQASTSRLVVERPLPLAMPVEDVTAVALAETGERKPAPSQPEPLEEEIPAEEQASPAVSVPENPEPIQAETAPRTEPPPEMTPPDAAGKAASRGSVASVGAQADVLPRKSPLNRPPIYPRDALLAGSEGLVLLRVLVSAQGTVSTLAVERSSGVPALDTSAQSAVARWLFEPARRGRIAIAYEVLVPVRFSIRNG